MDEAQTCGGGLEDGLGAGGLDPEDEIGEDLVWRKEEEEEEDF